MSEPKCPACGGARGSTIYPVCPRCLGDGGIVPVELRHAWLKLTNDRVLDCDEYVRQYLAMVRAAKHNRRQARLHQRRSTHLPTKENPRP